MKTFQFGGYSGCSVNVKFKCLNCGHDEVKRPESVCHLKLTFLEGPFECCGCGKEVDYASDDFVSKEVVEPKQLSLF